MTVALLIAASHQARAGRAAIRPADVAAGEAHAAFGQRINLRRVNLRVALAAQFAVAEIVGKDDEDVGLALGRLRCRSADQQRNQQTQTTGRSRCVSEVSFHG